MRRTATTSVLLAALTMPGICRAAHTLAMTAYQPTQTENSIEVVPVTFLVIGSAFPGVEVGLVCRPYLLPLLNQWNSSDLVNQNVAAMAGINASASWSMQSPDTLHVVIDLTETRPVAMSDEVVAVTVQAVLRTAAISCRGGPKDPSMVDLEIRGPEEYCTAARVYSCEELTGGPRFRRVASIEGTPTYAEMSEEERLCLWDYLPLGSSSAQCRALVPTLSPRRGGASLADAATEVEILGCRAQLEFAFAADTL